MTQPVPQTTQSISVRAEPAIAVAHQRLVGGDTKGAHEAIRSALDTIRLLGPAHPEEQQLSEALKQLERQLKSETVQFNWNGDRSCRIDADAIAATLRVAIENAALSGDAALIVEIDAEAEPPVVEIVFDGPGSIPDTWFIGGIVPLPYEGMRRHWTRHTVGGRIDRTENGIAFKLVGQREPEPNPGEQESVTALIVEAERALRLSAADNTVPDLSVLQSALDAIDEASPAPEPSDVCALLRGLVGDTQGFELQCSDSLPPIALRRDRLAASLARLCILAQPRIDAGASVTIIAEYNGSDRAAEIECAFPVAGNEVAWRAACIALERIVDVLHDGVFIADLSDDECTISLTIPDSIGATLHDWIPGFDALSERSIQMLRLLKSGGQAPPEDLILGGVLESELERWLMPQLQTSGAVNVAHELEKGKNPPRLEKALGQIRRGKAKKEICSQPYASVILGAYRRDDRGRRALGLDSLAADEIDALLDALLSKPLGYVTCLRLLVKITRAA